MPSSIALRMPLRGRRLSDLVTQHAASCWLLIHLCALWPHGWWIWQRVTDGSDDPLGIAALCMLALLVVRRSARLRQRPRSSWLCAALGLMVAGTLALASLPPLLAALLATLGWIVHLAAWLPAGVARLPLAGLALLTLPLVSSLQFYLGFPLRVMTAQLSAWGLQMIGIAAERSGASMLVRGQLVIVDAPCSGVQLAWLAYFTAFSVAAFSGIADGSFLRRLPWVGLMALAGNTLRNAVLVMLESRPQGLSPALHEGIGLLVVATVCMAVVRLLGARSAHVRVD